MADLKSYVEKYLLNPGSSFNVDEDGNKETQAQIVDKLVDEEGFSQGSLAVSKLRAQNASLLAASDPRYRGKKVSRKDLKKDDEVTYDPSLTKFFAIEDDESGDEEENEESDVDNDDDDEVSNEEQDSEGEEDSEIYSKEASSSRNPKSSLGEDEGHISGESEEGEGYDEDEEEETIKKIHLRLQAKSDEFTFDNDGDFGKYGDIEMEEDEDDDNDDDDDDDGGGDGDESEEEMIEDDGQDKSFKKFSSEDQSSEVMQGRSVKSQLGVYDALFESRIGMQKVMASTNQLPRPDTYNLFLQENDANYTKNINKAKNSAKMLLNSLLEVQEMLMMKNPDTSYIITGKKNKSAGGSSDEEITSSEDEMEAEQSSEKTSSLKRKMKVEEYEAVLSKRHAASKPFMNSAINKWYEKTKLLSSRNAKNKFSGFEVSALQQIKNILINRQQLIKRTQMTGVTRGTVYQVLGHRDNANTEVENEEYDPEIFDDNDFYTRCLEEVLKAKVALSDDMIEVSRRWIQIQNLRRKAKRKVDTRASKGRKIRYELISKLQQYLAPCHPPQMDDGTINILFGSLFGGQTIKNIKESAATDVKEDTTTVDNKEDSTTVDIKETTDNVNKPNYDPTIGKYDPGYAIC